MWSNFIDSHINNYIVLFFHWRSILSFFLLHSQFLHPQSQIMKTPQTLQQIFEWQSQRFWEYWFENNKKKQHRSCLSPLSTSWSGKHFLAPYFAVSSISNENNNVHLTIFYEYWLKKQYITLLWSQKGTSLIFFTVPLKVRRIEILREDTEKYFTMQ